MLSLATLLVVAAPLAAFSAVATQPVGLVEEPVASLVANLAGPNGPERRSRSARPLTPDDLVAMRALDIQPADLAQSRDEAGRIDPDQVIAAKATGTTPENISEIRGLYPNADAGELIGARAVGVDEAFARQMRAIDPRADLEMVVGARAVGVTEAYAEQIRAHFPRISLDDLVSMRATGVTGKDIEIMRSSGMDVGTPDEVTSVKAVTGQTAATPRGTRPPGTVRAIRDGAVAIVGSDGTYASRRQPDGTIRSAAVASPPSPDPDDSD